MTDAHPSKSTRPQTAAQKLATPEAFLSRTDLRELGWSRRGVDAIFEQCPVIVVPGFSRPHVYVRDYLELIKKSTFRGDRVRAA